jgi:heme O synthase-like polyprenyltransferase
MLPVRDEGGEITAQVVLITTLPLIPLGLSATALGLAGLWSAGICTVAGLGFCWLSLQFFRARDDRSARRVFLGSITYLPLVLAAMTADRGAVSPAAFLRGRTGVAIEMPATQAPETPLPPGADPRAPQAEEGNAR